MTYREWTISSHADFLGWFARYTSPTGQTHHTKTGFPTEQQAVSYARAMIDFLRELEQARFANPLSLAPGNSVA